MRAFLIPLALAGAFSALAQPSSIATPDNGSQIYFSSPQILRGSDQVLNPKIFRFDVNGVSLVQQRAQEGVPNFTNFFQLTSVDISGDGAVQVTNAERPCFGGNACVFFERRQTTIASFGQSLTANGQARLSRNGRFYVLYGSTQFPLDRTTFGNRILNAQIQIPNAFFAGTQSGRAITADGGVLIRRDGALILWRTTGEVRIPTAEPVNAAVCDDAGTTIVYETAEHRSRLVRVGGGKEIPLNAGGESRDAQISGDGNIVIFAARVPTSPGLQLFTQFADGTGLRQISADPNGIVQATLTGTGWVTYASTGNGRLIGIDVRTGSNFEFLPALPSIQLTRGGFAPGSAIRIFGLGFASNVNVSLGPLPRVLAGVQVLLDGNAMPIQVVTPTEIRFQLPWELPPPAAGTARVTRLLAQTANSQFDAALDVNLQAIDPRAEPVSPPGADEELIAIHENNSSPVSSGSPAKSGEVVHINLTGLGPVNPPVATGVVTPAAPLSLITNPVNIQIGGVEAEILQIRLQPGFLGYYMADVRIPTGLAGPQLVAIRETFGGAAVSNTIGLIYVQ